MEQKIIYTGNLRSRYFNAKMKREFNRRMYPTVAPNPIQYQRASGKIPRDFKTITPNDSLELPGTYIKITFFKESILVIFYNA